MIKKVILFWMAIFIFSGCAQYEAFQDIKEAGKSRAANVADNKLENDIWYICQASPIGAIRRKWGNNSEVYNNFCKDSSGSVIERE